MKLAFGHKARSGKDTACEYFQKKYGGTILRFAKNVYFVQDLVQQYYNLPLEKDPKLLQTIGEGLRELDPDIWVNLLEKDIHKTEDNIFISDLRYPNEMEMLKKNGFITVKINRPNRPIDRDPNHLSETALNDAEFDIVINNDKDLDNFYHLLDLTMDQFQKFKENK